MSAYTIAVLGLVAALVSAVAAVLAFVRSGRHAARIERLEAERLAHATGYRFTVELCDPGRWSNYTVNGQRRWELLAHVTNAGAVDSPPVMVRAYVDGTLVGESAALPFRGKGALDLWVPFAADVRTPEPLGDGDLTLQVIGPGEDVLASWPSAASDA